MKRGLYVAVTGPATGPGRPGRRRSPPRSSSGSPLPRPVSRRDGEHRTHRLSRPVLPRWPARPRPARSPGPPGRHRVPRRHKDARIQGGPRPLAASTQCALSRAGQSGAEFSRGAAPVPIQTSTPASVRDIRPGAENRRRGTQTDGTAVWPSARRPLQACGDSRRIAGPERFSWARVCRGMRLTRDSLPIIEGPAHAAPAASLAR